MPRHKLRSPDGRFTSRPEVGDIAIFRQWEVRGPKIAGEYDRAYTGHWAAVASHRPKWARNYCRHQAIADDPQQAVHELEEQLVRQHARLNMVLQIDRK